MFQTGIKGTLKPETLFLQLQTGYILIPVSTSGNIIGELMFAVRLTRKYLNFRREICWPRIRLITVIDVNIYDTIPNLPSDILSYANMPYQILSYADWNIYEIAEEN